MLNFRRVVSFNVSSSTHLGIVFFHLLPPTARPLRNVQQQKKHALEGWQGKELTHEVPLFLQSLETIVMIFSKVLKLSIQSWFYERCGA